MTDGLCTLSHTQTPGIRRKVTFVCTGVKVDPSLLFVGINTTRHPTKELGNVKERRVLRGKPTYRVG